MPGVNVIVGNDGVNDLQGGADKDLIYGFDPNGPQGEVSSITATRVATGLSQAVFSTAAPGDSQRLFVVEQTGVIKVVDLVSGQVLATPFLTVPVDSNGERGLLGMAFDPDYANNGFFYIYRTVPGAIAHNEIERYHVSANANVADAASATSILNIGNLSAATNHNGGWIGFGPDGDLYAAVGENANSANAQSASNLLGKILRIDVHTDAFPADPAKNYAIPADNMFAASAGADEIFALGLRNPFRDSFDRATGDFYIADVGQSAWEEIDIGQGGANYGWPLFEGPAGSGTIGAGTLTAPIFSYDHSVGQAIIGGYVYRGQSEGLQGQYFFADEVSSKVFTLGFNGSSWVTTDRTAQIHTDAGAIVTPTSFGEDALGNLYIVGYGGDVFRLTPDVVSADQGDTLRGFGGDDMMFGGSGNDLLDGGTGKDILSGGPGDDRFVFAPGYGADVINDFVAGGGSVDRIDVTKFASIHTLTDVLAHANQAGGNTVINFGFGDTLTLQNVVKTSLSVDDFILKSVGQSDFGGNGHDDILWYRDDGTASIWDDGQIGNGHFVGTGVPLDWHVAGKGDFDGNGHDDILWYRDNATVSIWDKGQIGAAHVIADAGVVPGNWHIAATGDFDGNGHDDILWYRDNATVSIWDNGAIGSAHVIADAGVVPSSWHIAATGDFDGNGHSDILWRNDNGAVSIWDNGAIGSAHIIADAGVVPNGWHIAATGDFDGNGRSDILWRNDNGAVSIWDNGAIGSAHIIANPGVVPNSWHIADTGDYDGNGHSEIVWRNDNGAVSIWDNGDIASAHIVADAGVIPGGWHIV
jgi:glucose/arabinose dehydrogenase